MSDEHALAAQAAHTPAHNDNAVIRGRELPIPLYTFVYIVLAVLTAIEIALFELPRGFFTIPVMIVVSLIKAGLVVWFYMHLNKDSRLFAAILLAPVIMVILATLFLMIVPTGY